MSKHKSHKGHGHSHMGSHHGGHGTGHGGYDESPHHGGAMSEASNTHAGKSAKKSMKIEKDPHGDPAHHAMNEDCGVGFACGDTEGDEVGAYGGE